VTAAIDNLVPSTTSDPGSFDDATYQVTNAAPSAVCHLELWDLPGHHAFGSQQGFSHTHAGSTTPLRTT
jgi:hypothetical protein